jgi:TolB-like protein
MQRFLSELQRRKVLRVAAAYVVGAWIVLQVAVALQTAMSLAASFSGAILALLVIGLPVAVGLAWFFEITPEGIRRTVAAGDGALVKPQTTDLILAGALGLVVVVAIVQVLMSSDTATHTSTPVASSASAEAVKPEQPRLGDKSIAVLPFANLSPDKENEYFADGLTEELLNLLAKIGDLKVISRTSSFAFKGTNTPLPEIAKRLGVRHVLEGSVRSQGDTLRVTVQLIDVSTDTHVWSETYKRKMAEVFAVQDEIAGAIAQALNLEMSVASLATNPPTRNLQAYRRYLEGLNLYRSRGGFAPSQVTDRLQEAVTLDPDFAEAHAILAASRITRMTREVPSAVAREQAALARASAERAIKLKPKLSLPYAVLGALDRRQFAWESGMANAAKAVSLDPSDSVSRYLFGIMQLAVGQLDAAAGTFAQVQRLDPMLERVRAYLLALEIAKGNETAAQQLADQIARSPTATMQVLGNYHLARLAYERGDAAKAETHYRLTLPVTLRDRPFVSAVAKAFRAEAFKNDALKAVVEEAAANPSFNPTVAFLIFQARNEMFADLHAFLDAGETWKVNELTTTIIYDPRLKALRDDPRFKQLLRRVGLVDYWKKHGWPDRCRPKGEDDFECG